MTATEFKPMGKYANITSFAKFCVGLFVGFRFTEWGQFIGVARIFTGAALYSFVMYLEISSMDEKRKFFCGITNWGVLMLGYEIQRMIVYYNALR